MSVRRQNGNGAIHCYELDEVKVTGIWAAPYIYNHLFQEKANKNVLFSIKT